MDRVPWDIGSFVHTLTRGSLGSPITKTKTDKWRFLRLLYFLNDKNRPSRHWERDVEKLHEGFHFDRPPHWRNRVPLVDICAYCLMENHYHLLLYERSEDGIASFMHRLNSSISNHYKKNYDQSGLLNTPYESRVIEGQKYLDLVFFYINIKNPFETFPDGYASAVNNFSEAYQYAKEYQFSSFRDYVSENQWPIINREVMAKHISLKNLKSTAKDYIINRSVFTHPDDKTENLLIDS